jgi:2-octaprenyl-6-methoxyphenol hydroxylase
MRKNHIKTDVLIIGGGLSGLTLAGVLGETGVTVTIIDRDPPITQIAEQYDARTTALSFGSSRVLSAAGTWAEIERQAEPMLDIRVADGASPLFLHFSSDDNRNGAPFGWNLENRTLRTALFKNVTRLKKHVRHLAPVEIEKFFREEERVGVLLKNGTKISAPLMVGADGRNSAVRSWLGIDVKRIDYKQTAIVCNIEHTLPHENVAVEHFLPAGPFAALPLTRGTNGKSRSSIVWSVHGTDAGRILALPPSVFNAELQRLCGTHLGKVQLISQPRGYPLHLMHAARYTGPRVALMAEAAHAIHPIAGQGLNLGMRDVALLSELIIDRLRLGLDIGSPTPLKDYENIRHADAQLMASFTDILNHLFSNNLKSVALLRDVGLGIVQKMPVLKGFFAQQAMGLGGSPSRIIHEDSL